MALHDDAADGIRRAMNRGRFLRTTGFGAMAGIGVAAGDFLHPTPAAAATQIGTFLDQGGGVFNAKAYGAIGNGTTDDTAAIRSAISAAQSANGGVVYLPQGHYLVSGTLGVTANGVNLIGAGQSATVILASTGFASGDIITFTNTTGGSVRMLSINGASQRTGGAGIHLNNARQVYVQDTDMLQMYNGCVIDGGGVLQYIDRGYWTQFSSGGVGIWINASNSNDTYISNITIAQDGNPAVPRAGVRIQGSQAVWMRACDILSVQDGLLIDPAAGGQISWFFFEDCAWDNCVNHGILINPDPAVATCRGLNFVNCWTASSHANDGCYIGGPVDGVQFIGHRFYNNYANGLIANGPAKNIFVDASAAAGNNAGSVGGSGFVFAGGCTYFAVRNSRSGQYVSLPGQQQYGINVTSGCNNYILTGNMTAGNTAGGIGEPGASSRVVANNL